MLANLLLFLNLSFFLPQNSTTSDTMNFLQNQLSNERVSISYIQKNDYLEDLCKEKNLSFPPKNVFFRAFKTEKVFEAWVFSEDLNQYVLLKSYPICESSAVIGPKRQEGDMQVPEGFYEISVFNPMSNFFLSLGINYPNQSDSILTTNALSPGSDIYIHGDCVTVGCLPLNDENIKEVYLLAVYAKSAGQTTIPVHIFPFRFSNPLYAKLLDTYTNPIIKSFWLNLKDGYNFFEKKHLLPLIKVDTKGKYMFF